MGKGKGAWGKKGSKKKPALKIQDGRRGKKKEKKQPKKKDERRPEIQKGPTSTGAGGKKLRGIKESTKKREGGEENR